MNDRINALCEEVHRMHEELGDRFWERELTPIPLTTLEHICDLANTCSVILQPHFRGADRYIRSADLSEVEAGLARIATAAEELWAAGYDLRKKLQGGTATRSHSH